MAEEDTTGPEELRPERTALLVVDMTNEFVAEAGRFGISGAREMIPRLNRTIRESRDQGTPVVFLREVNRPGGHDAGVKSRLSPGTPGRDVHAPGWQTELHDDVDFDAEVDIDIVKRQYSGFHGTELDDVLRGLNVERVVITGVASQICCNATAEDAFYHGYRVLVLSDCTAAARIRDQGWGEFSAETVQRFWLSRMATYFGDVTDASGYCEALSASATR